LGECYGPCIGLEMNGSQLAAAPLWATLPPIGRFPASAAGDGLALS
jgi:hypothetical protein